MEKNKAGKVAVNTWQMCTTSDQEGLKDQAQEVLTLLSNEALE